MTTRRFTVASLLASERVISIAVVALGVGLSIAFLAVSGVDLSEALPALAKGAAGDARAFEETLRQSIPLMFIGLGVAVGLRAGLFNIGGEGQLYVAALAAIVISQAVPIGIPFFAVMMILVVGVAAGVVWGGSAGWMKSRLGMNEVITTILLNEIGILLAGWAIHGPLRDRAGGGYPWSKAIGVQFRLPVLEIGPLSIPFGIVLAGVFAVGVYVLLERSRFGLQLRTLGDNPDVAEYSGMSVRRLTVLAMVIAGGLSGLAGVVELAGTQHRLSDFFSPGYGFTAIAVALVGNARSGGVVAAALLFGGLRAGASSMERIAQVPAATSLIAQAIIILLLVIARSERLALWMRQRRSVGELLAGGGEE
ncbi:MAG: ABC transporter permease [Gammaproteobacteria bacterium]|nr:ABC transporter permease [Gammaproteobacteria bacterium]